MNLVRFLDIALDTDMIIIYALIALMAILLIIIFTFDAKSKKKDVPEENVVIKGTTPIDKYNHINEDNLQAKVEQKIEELEQNQKVVEEEIIEKKEENESNIKYVEDKTEEEIKEAAQEELNQVALNLIDDNTKEDKPTDFEIEQEENAIISYNELVKVSENLYNENEKTQYLDEGNEPITIDQLREKFSDDKNVEKQEDTTENKDSLLVNAIDEILKEDKLDEQKENSRPVVKLDNFMEVPIKKEETTPKFKSSPIISPVYGTLKNESIKKDTEIELEQTADLEKLDAEIRKTNEFLQILKELQKKLD